MVQLSTSCHMLATTCSHTHNSVFCPEVPFLDRVTVKLSLRMFLDLPSVFLETRKEANRWRLENPSSAPLKPTLLLCQRSESYGLKGLDFHGCSACLSQHVLSWFTFFVHGQLDWKTAFPSYGHQSRVEQSTSAAPHPTRAHIQTQVLQKLEVRLQSHTTKLNNSSACRSLFLGRLTMCDVTWPVCIDQDGKKHRTEQSSL